MVECIIKGWGKWGGGWHAGAFDVVNLTPDRQRVKEGFTHCKRQPGTPNGNVVSEAVLNLHQLFWAMKIAILYLKNNGVYRTIEKADFVKIMHEMKGLYGLKDEFKFDVVYKDHDWAIRTLRKSRVGI
jgi:hypothetical protein